MKKTKVIGVDIYATIEFQQYFEVPEDFELDNSESKKAYQKLIDQTGDQNKDVLKSIYDVDLRDWTLNSFDSFGEFIEYKTSNGRESERLVSIKYNKSNSD